MTGRNLNIIGIAAIIAAILLWMFCGKPVAAEAVYPVQNSRNWFSRNVASRFSAVFSRIRTAEENRSLKREIEALRMVRMDSEALAAENLRLRSLLGLDSPPPFPFSTNSWICAPILSRGGAAGASFAIKAGKGSLAGVKPGAPVAVPDGLVGRVRETSLHTATIDLISSPSIRVSCEVELEDSDYGSILGILGGGGGSASRESETSLFYVFNPLRIRHLGRRPDIPPRARIVTSGLGGVFPRGIPVGFLIDGQREDESALEREGDVVPAVDFHSLDFVFIRRHEK